MNHRQLALFALTKNGKFMIINHFSSLPSGATIFQRKHELATNLHLYPQLAFVWISQPPLSSSFLSLFPEMQEINFFRTSGSASTLLRQLFIKLTSGTRPFEVQEETNGLFKDFLFSSFNSVQSASKI